MQIGSEGWQNDRFETNWVRRKNLLAMSLAALFAAFYVACGAAAPADPGNNGTASTGEESAPAPTTAVMPVNPPEVTKSVGALRIAYASLGNDGIYPESSNVNAGGKDIQTTVYDVVIGSDAHGTFSSRNKATVSCHYWTDAMT